ncbi:MAG: phage tail protein, partial [Alphaproteobacteria bacterium]|nr:phage tail protein [Alphaproteobacteria bacterium]
MTVSGDGLLAFEWFQGDGVSTTFDIKFYFLANEDLKFLLEREDGTLEGVTPSQIVGAGDPNGGSFTLSTAPSPVERAGVFRDLSLGQPTDVEAQEDIPPAAIQIALDRLAMVNIQQQDDIERAIRLSDSDEPGDFRIPVQAERANRYLAFDANGDPIARTITDIGAAEIATQEEANAGEGDGLITAELLGGGAAVGDLKWSDAQTTPEDHLLCDGSLVLIDDFPELFAAIGTQFGGDGVTDFRLRDARGVFPRFKDHGRGLDPDGDRPLGD